MTTYNANWEKNGKTLKEYLGEFVIKYDKTHVGKVIVVNVNARIRQHFSKVVCGAHKEVIPDNISYHFLVQVAICDFFPISVLKIIFKLIIIN